MKKDDILYMVIPVYNEEENLDQVITDWLPMAERYDGHIVFVNDGSTDGSADRIRAAMEKSERIELLDKENGGHGSAVLAGYYYALEHGATLVFQTDSDGQTDPADFPGFMHRIQFHDAVIGERLVRGDGKMRKKVEDILCFIIRCVFDVKLNDSNAPFRLMRAELLLRYLDTMPRNYMLPNVVLSICFAYYGEYVEYKPIHFYNRKKGKGSINLKKLVRIGKATIKDFTREKKRMDAKIADVCCR